MDIMTIEQLNSALKSAREVFIQARFGTSEQWVKISKREATTLVGGFPPNATPHDCEMSTGTFGHLNRDCLFLG